MIVYHVRRCLVILLAFMAILGCRERQPATPAAVTVAPGPTAVAQPALHARPREAPADTPVAIEVTGLAPGRRVTLTASLRDDFDRRWEAWAAFAAAADGRVDLATQAPLTGTYTDVDPMGLFWSMHSRVPGSDPFFVANFAEDAVPVTLTAVDTTGTIGSHIFIRQRLPENATAVDVAEKGLVGRFYTPAGPGPHPALLVLGGSGGGVPTGTAIALAGHGYATLALAYFGVGSLPESLTEIPLEYFQTALNWLQAQPEVNGSRLGVVGGSRGGELALLLGATYPELTLVVGFVPSGVVLGNLSATEMGARAAWTLDGEPLPFPTNFGAFQLAEATIPVERINGPVLLISGGKDEVWPSTELSAIAYDRLVAHKHPFPYEHLAYPDAGHLIGLPYWPATTTTAVHPVTGDPITFGGTPQANAAASADAWARTLAFLDAWSR